MAQLECRTLFSYTYIAVLLAPTHARTQWGSTTKQVSLMCTYIAGCSVLMGPGSLGRCRDIAAQSSVNSVCVCVCVWVRESEYVCCVRVWRPALLLLLLVFKFSRVLHVLPANWNYLFHFFLIWILLLALPLVVLLLVLVYCAVLCWCWCWPLCGFLLSRRRPAKYILNNDDGAAATAAAVSVSAIFTTFGQSVSLKYKCRLCSQCVLDVRNVKEKTTHTHIYTGAHTQTDTRTRRLPRSE